MNNNKNLYAKLIPVMLCFFAMGFVDLVGPFDRPEARADRRRRARLGRRRRLQLRGRMLCQSHQPLERERARYLERDPPQRPAGERYGGQER